MNPEQVLTQCVHQVQAVLEHYLPELPRPDFRASFSPGRLPGDAFAAVSPDFREQRWRMEVNLSKFVIHRTRHPSNIWFMLCHEYVHFYSYIAFSQRPGFWSLWGRRYLWALNRSRVWFEGAADYAALYVTRCLLADLVTDRWPIDQLSSFGPTQQNATPLHLNLLGALIDRPVQHLRTIRHFKRQPDLSARELCLSFLRPDDIKTINEQADRSFTAPRSYWRRLQPYTLGLQACGQIMSRQHLTIPELITTPMTSRQLLTLASSAT